MNFQLTRAVCCGHCGCYAENISRLSFATYQYHIEYQKPGENPNADAMSRLIPLTSEDESGTEVFMISYVDELPITAGDVASVTRKDPILACVRFYLAWMAPICERSLVAAILLILR